jgi:flagellar hook-basal body complex protein FliE
MVAPVQAYAKALAAYGKAAAGASEAPVGVVAETGSGSDFASLLNRAMDDTLSAGRATESLVTKAVTGGAELAEVVSAVAEAEVTLQSVVAVRDRVIEAYKEIMRMPI